MKKNIFLRLPYLILMFSGLISVLTNCENKFIRTGQICKTQADCANNPNCLCYCAFKPGYRKKTAKDTSPIYFNRNEDPYGKGCYCAQRDLDKLKKEYSHLPKSEIERLLPN